MFTTKKVNETYISKYASIHKIYKYSIVSIIMKTYIRDWKEIINIKIEKYYGYILTIYFELAHQL